MNEKDPRLGKKGCCKVSGLMGTIDGKCEMLHGSTQFRLTPPSVDGRAESRWIEESALEVID